MTKSEMELEEFAVRTLLPKALDARRKNETLGAISLSLLTCGSACYAICIVAAVWLDLTISVLVVLPCAILFTVSITCGLIARENPVMSDERITYLKFVAPAYKKH